MTAEQAIEAYTERFGGFPWFLFMGANDDCIVDAVEEALDSGKEIEAPDDGNLY